MRSKALGYGFTSLRDLETEGAMYADVDLKNAIARGVIPGPRMTVATRALAPTGMYPLRGYNWELTMPIGVQTIDGVDEARKAVREQVGKGADWIKFYADHAPYETKRADRPVRSIVNFTPAEAAAIVDEAHRLGVKVAAHANGWDGIDSALRAGVDSIEHGQGLTEDLIARMLAQHVAWCPTMLAYQYEQKKLGPTPRAFMVPIHKAAVARAYKRGVRIVFGTDAGAFPWSVDPAQEAKLMVDAGMTPAAVIRAMTSAAAALLDPFCKPDAKTCAQSAGRRRRARHVRRPRRSRWQPARGHHRARARDVGHERRHGDRAVAGGNGCSRIVGHGAGLDSRHETDLGWIDRRQRGGRGRDAARRRARSSSCEVSSSAMTAGSRRMRRARSSRSASPRRRPAQTAGHASREPRRTRG